LQKTKIKSLTNPGIIENVLDMKVSVNH